MSDNVAGLIAKWRKEGDDYLRSIGLGKNTRYVGYQHADELEQALAGEGERLSEERQLLCDIVDLFRGDFGDNVGEELYGHAGKEVSPGGQYLDRWLIRAEAALASQSAAPTCEVCKAPLEIAQGEHVCGLTAVEAYSLGWRRGNNAQPSAPPAGEPMTFNEKPIVGIRGIIEASFPDAAGYERESSIAFLEDMQKRERDAGRLAGLEEAAKILWKSGQSIAAEILERAAATQRKGGDK